MSFVCVVCVCVVSFVYVCCLCVYVCVLFVRVCCLCVCMNICMQESFFLEDMYVAAAFTYYLLFRWEANKSRRRGELSILDADNKYLGEPLLRWSWSRGHISMQLYSCVYVYICVGSEKNGLFCNEYWWHADWNMSCALIYHRQMCGWPVHPV